MNYAIISPPVLQWARQRSNLDIDSIAQKLTVKTEKVIGWEDGSAKPTFFQAQRLANILHIPFGYLFLQQPPQEKLQIPDLRTIKDQQLTDYSVDLKEVISDVLRKQDWYRDYLKEQESHELSFIGRFEINSEIDAVAQDIVKFLRLTVEDRCSCHNWDEFFRLLVERTENIGILVMRSGKVGNNTHRILKVEEFRGFVICDSLAPVIFINGADAKAAQIFTIVHEIAHLWFGKSGVSDIGLRKDTVKIKNILEMKCNEVAAEVLVPRELVNDRWYKRHNISENVTTLSRYFKVSTIVIARRALDLNLITDQEFFDFYQQQMESWQQQKEQQDGGGSFYKNLPVVNSYKFSKTILQSVYSQEILLRDGARLLGINAVTFDNYAKEVGFI